MTEEVLLKLMELCKQKEFDKDTLNLLYNWFSSMNNTSGEYELLTFVEASSKEEIITYIKQMYSKEIQIVNNENVTDKEINNFIDLIIALLKDKPIILLCIFGGMLYVITKTIV